MTSPATYNRNAIGKHWHLLGFMESEDWRGFTRRYNGPGNVDVYSGRLIRAFKVIKSLEQDGASFSLPG